MNPYATKEPFNILPSFLKTIAYAFPPCLISAFIVRKEIQPDKCVPAPDRNGPGRVAYSTQLTPLYSRFLCGGYSQRTEALQVSARESFCVLQAFFIMGIAVLIGLIRKHGVVTDPCSVSGRVLHHAILQLNAVQFFQQSISQQEQNRCRTEGLANINIKSGGKNCQHRR